jgi:hypothetical protein
MDSSASSTVLFFSKCHIFRILKISFKTFQESVVTFVTSYPQNVDGQLGQTNRLPRSKLLQLERSEAGIAAVTGTLATGAP